MTTGDGDAAAGARTSGHQPEFTYFGIQSMWGVTKHFGGLSATDRLARACGIRSGTRVLEVGCGAGITSCHLVAHYECELVCVDLSDRMLEWARQRAERRGLADRIAWKRADVQDLPFDAGRFDAVIAESVMAFVPDKGRGLAECVRVVRPGGSVGIVEGTWLREDTPDELEAALRQMMDGVQFGHEAAWCALLEGAGLVDVTADVRPVRAMRQRLDEMQGLDLHDYVGRVRAFGTFGGLLARSPAFRRYARSLVPSLGLLRGMFRYLGYGAYVGRKPA